MHVSLRRVAPRPAGQAPVWFFRWGVSFWLGRILFGFGHDARGTMVTWSGQ